MLYFPMCHSIAGGGWDDLDTIDVGIDHLQTRRGASKGPSAGVTWDHVQNSWPPWRKRMENRVI